MPRFLHVLVFVLAFMASGGPTWIAELTRDDCAEPCASESTCPDEGCADCSLTCSSCPRAHVVVPLQVSRVEPAWVGVSQLTYDAGERVPVGPPPEGVFHPPRPVG